MCRYPFGSGGNRVCTRPPCRPLRWSSATISRTKSSGAAGAEVPASNSISQLYVPAFAASPLRRDIRSRLRRFGEIFEVMRGVDRLDRREQRNERDGACQQDALVQAVLN